MTDAQAKVLSALLRRLGDEFPPAPDSPATAGSGDTAAGAQPAPPRRTPLPPTAAIDPAEPLIAEFVWSFLLWETTTPKAAGASRRLAADVVDFNELRVCLPDETCRLLGERYPRAAERAQRLRAALGCIFDREHAVTLEHLAQRNKRDARAYLESVDGVPPFVAARVFVFALDGHAVPVDSRLAARLAQAGALDPGCDPAEVSAAIERRIRAADIHESCRVLQLWSDQEPAGEPGGGATGAQRGTKDGAPGHAGRPGHAKARKAGGRS